jgi:benzoate membrane transport protein
VMAMVAGVFLGFGIDLVAAVDSDAMIAAPMVLVFLLATASPGLGRFVPPIIGALVVGVLAVVATGAIDGPAFSGPWLAAPVLTAPLFTWSAAIELVVPLAITVLVVQNGQGMAVLREAGHRPPMNLVTVACGVVSLPAAAVGAISTSLTGPTNALLTASGERRRHYASALVCGSIAIVVGLLAPGFVRLLLAMPVAFVAALGGLAMLRALEGAFRTAFSGTHVTAALVTFLVTVAEVTFLNIGAAFWGLVAGVAVHILLARDATG